MTHWHSALHLVGILVSEVVGLCPSRGAEADRNQRPTHQQPLTCIEVLRSSVVYRIMGYGAGPHL